MGAALTVSSPAARPSRCGRLRHPWLLVPCPVAAHHARVSLFRSIYISRVSRQVRFADAELIAQAAAENNRNHGITGILVYSPSHFIQVLEGEEAEVTAVLSRIQRDPRHFDFRIIDACPVREREFGEWAMVARRLPKSKELDLEGLNLESVLQLLRDASGSISN